MCQTPYSVSPKARLSSREPAMYITMVAPTPEAHRSYAMHCRYHVVYFSFGFKANGNQDTIITKGTTLEQQHSIVFNGFL